jgi:hypothetical protein
LPDGFQTEFIETAERGQTGRGEDSVEHVEVFRMVDLDAYPPTPPTTPSTAKSHFIANKPVAARSTVWSAARVNAQTDGVWPPLTSQWWGVDPQHAGLRRGRVAEPVWEVALEAEAVPSAKAQVTIVDP